MRVSLKVLFIVLETFVHPSRQVAEHFYGNRNLIQDDLSKGIPIYGQTLINGSQSRFGTD